MKINDDNGNILICTKCKAPLIAEEFHSHTCFKIKDFWVIDGEIWIGDGKKYYLYNSPTRNQHDPKHSEDSTEPNKLFLFGQTCIFTEKRKNSHLKIKYL
jgi:hypothetical protein